MKIALLGYGKMGKTIEQLAIEKGHQIVLKITSENKAALTTNNLAKADVAIDFSRPETAFENIQRCLTSGIPVVSGTTAWLEHYEEACALCEEQNGAFLYASNFSIGVNIFFAINKRLAEMMNEQTAYDIELEEIHHTQKLDAPSGTAITLANGILENVDRKNKWTKEIKEVDTDLPIRSKRIDKVPGTHSINYSSEIDSIEIKHTAFTRIGFAKGALVAAEWIVDKKGVFNMNDVLGF